MAPRLAKGTSVSLTAPAATASSETRRSLTRTQPFSHSLGATYAIRSAPTCAKDSYNLLPGYMDSYAN